MECERVLEFILEADPGTLENCLSEDGEHAGHVAGCTGCADAVRTVLAFHANLEQELAAVTPSTPIDRALREARAEADRRKASGHRGLWRGLVPLAAAASVAGLLAIRSGGIAPGGGPGEAYDRPVLLANAGREVEVTAPEGTSVAVFRTPNPDIVVYWFFEGGEGR